MVGSPAHRTFANDAREIRRMSEWWLAWTAANAVPQAVRDRGELCLNEAAANVVQHNTVAKTITTTLERENGIVTIVITDDGAAFDPSAQSRRSPPETLEEAEPGGLGLHILDSYADAVSYERVGGINVLTLTFRG